MQNSLEAFQQILAAIPYPVFVKDKEHRWVLVNDAFCAMMGQPREALLGKSDYDFVPAAQADVFWAVDDAVLRTGEPNENEEVLTDASGSVRVIVTRKCRIQLPADGEMKPFIVAIFSDVTQFREAEARAQYHAHHDSLTGLANRMYLTDRLETTLREARESGKQVALFLLDLDGFKKVNDCYGHAAGDDLLRIIAQRLKRAARGTDIIARLGGDEFCICQAAPAGTRAVEALACRIIKAVAGPVTGSWGTARVSASIGIAIAPNHGAGQEELLRRADLALYRVKHAGRGAYAVYSPEEDDSQASENGLAMNLQAAILRREITLAFQPLIAMEDGSTRAFEALARWHHPEHGAIPPGVFIPLAERKGLMPELGRLILEQACEAAAAWPAHLQLRVNISPAQFEGGNLVPIVETALSKAGLAPERLEIEVTEYVLMGDNRPVLETFKALKKLGVKIALDDFGSGWASLDMVTRFPFDRLKIDGSFVAQMETDPRATAIVRAVLSLGKALDLPVTAEGVERAAQLEALRQMGCNEVQGYLFGKPIQENPQAASAAVA